MPRITEITVSAGRVISHPFKQYENLRPMITLKAVLDDGEDFEVVAKDLQAKAEGMIEDHGRYMVKSLEELEALTRRQSRVASLEASIRRAQADLNVLRKEMPSLADLSAKDESEDDRDDDDEPFHPGRWK